jgi:hypothetical protein
MSWVLSPFLSILHYPRKCYSLETKHRKRIRERERVRELESNFRVNLIWVEWVNFNLGGFFLFGFG